MKKRLTYEVTTTARLDYEDETPTVKPVLKEVDVVMDVSKNLDRKAFFDKKGLPNSDGTKAITNVLVCGLSNNIHQAHQAGLWDSAAHLRYIIAELERQFVQPATAIEATTKDINDGV